MVFSKGSLFLCDGCKILKIDPTTGKYHIAKEGLVNFSLSTVNYRTGDILVFDQEHGFRKMNPDTLAFSECPTASLANAFCGGACFTGRGDEMVRITTTHTLERVDCAGNVIESVKAPGSLFKVYSAADGVIVNNTTGFFFWQFGTKTIRLLVGHASAAGDSDGIGWRARFRGMMLPVYGGGRFLFVRDLDANTSLPSRYVRVDVQTDEVRTLAIRDFDVGSDFWCSVATEETLFVVAKTASSSASDLPVGLQLWRVPANGACEDSLVKKWREIDLGKMANLITFKFFDGKVLHFDPRLLTARSQYFKGMLASDFREAVDNVVDLQHDASIECSALEDLLLFMATDLFEPVDQSPDHALKVWKLADMYQMHDLRSRVEQVLSRSLTRDNVLQFLSKVFQSNSALEQACWAFLEETGREVIYESESLLPSLIADHQKLVKALMIWAAGPPSGKKRRKS